MQFPEGMSNRNNTPSDYTGFFTRRSFFKRQLGSFASLAAMSAGRKLGVSQEATPPLGQGDFRYRVVPNWGVLGTATPVAHCHGIACTRSDQIILLTTHTANNVIVYDTRGKLLHKWGTTFPGAHGLSLVEENGREVLFITDLNRHLVVKTSLTGETLEEWHWPKESGKYPSEKDFRPSWTLHPEGGGFFVLDGYGLDYISHYGEDGKLLKTFGGKEGGIVHWGPHGGMVDRPKNGVESLLIAMSDQQHLLRLSFAGDHLMEVPLPGGNPRQIRRFGSHYFVAHLADNWPKNRNSRGFVSILDEHLRVVSNIGGSPPWYSDEGKLLPMKNTDPAFIHPHDLTVDAEGSLYVAQFQSGNTYPVKLERI
jgi:hypothetical protein